MRCGCGCLEHGWLCDCCVGEEGGYGDGVCVAGVCVWWWRRGGRRRMLWEFGRGNVMVQFVAAVCVCVCVCFVSVNVAIAIANRVVLVLVAIPSPGSYCCCLVSAHNQ